MPVRSLTRSKGSAFRCLPNLRGFKDFRKTSTLYGHERFSQEPPTLRPTDLDSLRVGHAVAVSRNALM